MSKNEPQPKKPLPVPPNPDNEWHFTTEGVEFVLDWDKFPIQGFVFIPCIETEKVIASLRKEAAKQRMSLTFRVGIRNGYWGVGVWRTR